MKYLLNIVNALGESIGVYTAEQFKELLISSHHSTPLSLHRAKVIQSRVFFFSVVFALLVPAWSVIDILFLPYWLWSDLLLLRLVSGACFVLIAWQARKQNELSRARILLAALLAIPPLFYIIADQWLHTYPLSGTELIAAELYQLLPFAVIGGMTLFPLTLFEFVAYAFPLFLVTVYSTHIETVEDIPRAFSTLWLFVLIFGVAMFASMTQLRYMLSQASRVSYDSLTGALSRRAGIEMLDIQFHMAGMSEAAMSILYFDLDNFKAVNDTFGHDSGDSVLRTAAQQLNKTVRKGDSVIRWGGEEFIVILPMADSVQANEVVMRIMRAGIGLRPDGTPLTASIGVVEIKEAEPPDWKSMVELGDRRMYKAKSAGRARCVDGCGHMLLWTDYATK